MKQQIATTREQADRLLQCGVSAESADMYINNYDELWTVPFKDCARKNEKGFAPAWSLSALIALLPKEIEADANSYDEVQKYGLLIYPCYSDWQIEYQGCMADECHSLICVYDTDLIEPCVKAIEWLTANGYQLNGIEKGGPEQ